jgi:hypothetical protein
MKEVKSMLKRSWLPLLLALAALSLGLAACGPASDDATTSPLATPADTETMPAPTATGTPASGAALPEGAEEVVAEVRQDLAEQLDVAPGDIEVVDAQPAEWSDSSLGCPREGQTYAQAIVPGHRVILQAGGKRYAYHTGDGNWILCEAPAAQERDIEPTPPGELAPEAQALVDKATQDLADRLDTRGDEIVVQSVEAVQWRDSSLGCPRPGMNYLQVITPGYLIRLEAGGEIYEYHTDTENVVYCEQAAYGKVEPMVGKEQLVALAKADLVKTAGVAENEIQVLEVQYVEWRDGSLGCAKAGKNYPQVITPGYLIRLSVAGREYEYHTDMRRVMLCRQ